MLQEIINDLKKKFALSEQDIGKDMFTCLGIELTMDLFGLSLQRRTQSFCTLPVGVEHPMHFNRDVVLKLTKSLH